jgi:1-acyl-sn-glycerol-3-phosphate acyltransferase
MGALRNAIKTVFGRIIRIYFRRVEVSGAVPPDDTGGRLFGANHVNGLVDPILVLTTVPFDVSPIAKSTLFSIPGLRQLLDIAGAVPIIRRRDNPDKSAADNDAVFERIAQHLAGRGNILIFPEGTSHSEPHLAALRTGAGRMLAAAKNKGGKGLTFQAVALEFEDRDTFRSRALVLFGPVREIDALATNADDDKSADEALVAKITETMRADLSELLVEGKTWPERRLIARVTELYVNDGDDATLARWNDVGRRAERASKMLAAEPDLVASLTAKLDAYYTHLAEARATDAVVSGKSPAQVDRALLLLLLLPLALVGALLYFLPYQLPRFVVARTHPDRDVVSTYKLGVGLALFPLWAAGLSAAAFAWLPRVQAAGATAAILLCPFAALAWLDDLDALRGRLRAVRPGATKRALAALSEERAAVMKTLEEVRARVEG